MQNLTNQIEALKRDIQDKYKALAVLEISLTKARTDQFKKLYKKSAYDVYEKSKSSSSPTQEELDAYLAIYGEQRK